MFRLRDFIFGKFVACVVNIATPLQDKETSAVRVHEAQSGIGMFLVYRIG